MIYTCNKHCTYETRNTNINTVSSDVITKLLSMPLEIIKISVVTSVQQLVLILRKKAPTQLYCKYLTVPCK